MQSEGKDKPETYLNALWQEEHPDATKGREIAGYNPDIDYKWSKPKAMLVAHEQRKVNPDSEYAKLEMPRSETFHQRMLPLDVCMGILWVHKA